jgi:predicted nucleic acid-binding protein
MKSVPLPETYLSVVTLAEIRRGITVARDPIRQQKLESWLAGIRASYQDRVLPVDETIAELAGTLEGICQLVGRPAEPFDALIAATAQHHALTVVTRNVTDFEVWGGPVFNPWTGT